MQYVIWSNELNTATSVVQNLPDNLVGLPTDQLNAMGYRELVTHRPEDYIPRFSMLSGSSFFYLGDDGRVHQEFPQADFSLNAVRNHLKEMAAKDASRVLFETDWYVIRKFETGKEIPEDVARVRKMIRDHVEWISNDVDNTDARALVEYRWAFPMDADRVLIQGTWAKTSDPNILGDDNPDKFNPPPPLANVPNPVQVPPQFNSWTTPLQVNIPAENLTNPADEADVAPIISDDQRVFVDNEQVPQGEIINKDGTDIRAYSPREVAEMPDEMYWRLMEKYVRAYRPDDELEPFLKRKEANQRA